MKLYNVAVIFAAQVGHRKAQNLVEKRRLSLQVQNKSNTIWIHAASAGEGNQAIPIAKVLKKKNECWIVISFFSPSGYDFHIDTECFDQVIILPEDSKKNAVDLIQKLKPKLAIFIKKEFWWNYLNVLNQNKIPAFLVNAAPKDLSPKNIFLKYYHEKCLSLFTKIYVTQTPKANLNKRLPIAEITGDTKFESAFSIDQNERLDQIESFSKGHFCIIIGSSWPKEEEYLRHWLSLNSSKNIKVIIAPHEINSTRINQLENRFKNSILFTQLGANSNVQTLILNQMGLLKSAYQYTDIAIIGGGLGKGIHNILEAITYKIPTFFGPNYSKFEEATDLIDKQLAFSFSSQEEFNNLMNNWVLANEKLLKLKDQLQNYMSNKTAISNEIVEDIVKSIKSQT
ncbi:MAG: glycosyltransferase N-terminal domain-containing protein [Chitinophagales bacterium]